MPTAAYSMLFLSPMYRSCLQWLILSLGLTLTGCGPSSDIKEFAGQQQGTTYHVKVVIDPSKISERSLQELIDAIFNRVDLAVSNYRDDSELSRFNHQKTTDWVSVSAELAYLTSLAQEVSDKTHGCFDLTIKPLFDLWGFSKAGPQKVPPEAEIRRVMKHVGMEKIEVDRSGRRMRKRDPEIQLDLSSIGQGYTVGVIATALEQQGLIDYLVEIGGELKVRGRKPDGSHWRVAVEKPSPFSKEIQSLIDVRETQGTAIMTAGTYRHYFEQEGQVYSHIMDPRSGRPVTHNLLSVTILHEDPPLADLWDTALLCVGEDEALKVAQEEGLKVLLISDHEHQLVETMSPAFLKEKDAPSDLGIGISYPEKQN
ncbi:MAG TPA: FAD:protein FMN transferase [Methylococcaceae bacterium]|nr:FAD:protein FMN transferase [Methylococcaceae bacterium]